MNVSSLSSIPSVLVVASAAVLCLTPSACNSGECANECETNAWARLIVGVIPPEGVTTPGEELVSVRGRYEDGRVMDGNRRGCPKMPPPFICSFSFSASPRVRSILLEVEDPDTGIAEVNVELAPHNYCGRDIAYVLVHLSADAMPEFAEPEYISPCELL